MVLEAGLGAMAGCVGRQLRAGVVERLEVKMIMVGRVAGVRQSIRKDTVVMGSRGCGRSNNHLGGGGRWVRG